MLVFGNQDWITTLYYAFQDKENLVRGRDRDVGRREGGGGGGGGGGGREGGREGGRDRRGTTLLQYM